MAETELRDAVAAGVLAAEAGQRELLQSIVEVARAIFNARASSIFVLDEQTDELVFEAVAGEGAETVIGLRIPSSTGIAGLGARFGRADGPLRRLAGPTFRTRRGGGHWLCAQVADGRAAPARRTQSGRAAGARPAAGQAVLARRDGSPGQVRAPGGDRARRARAGPPRAGRRRGRLARQRCPGSPPRSTRSRRTGVRRASSCSRRSSGFSLAKRSEAAHAASLPASS